MDFDFKALLVILVVVLIIFGGRKLRNIGDDLGHAVRGFKKAMNEGDREETADSPRHLRSEGAHVEFPDVLQSGGQASKSARNA